MDPLSAAITLAQSVANGDRCPIYVVENNARIFDPGQRFLFLAARELHNYAIPRRDIVGLVHPQPQPHDQARNPRHSLAHVVPSARTA